MAEQATEQNEAAILPVIPVEEALPRQFGKYTLLRKIAAGGMAEIFLALHRSVAGFEKLIVIKRILPSMNQDQGFIEMFLHEARIAATLSHPNIVQIFDVGHVDGIYFIAMEHIHGEDIRSIIRGMKRAGVAEIPLEHCLAIGLGMCAGLAYAHDKRDLQGARLDIVHRDISPQNIVVTFTGDVKIVDFGIAKSGSQVGEDTKDGQLKGKVPYMSPEQASGGNVDWRSDIFATGVMLFELTTSRRLFKGSSEYETLKLICEKDYPLPSQVRPDYPPALERIVMKALAKTREERYQSAREMQTDLEAFVREERIPVSTVSLTQWMESLFSDTLTKQKEALQDVKKFADVIAAQYELTATGVGRSSATSVPPPKRSIVGMVVVGVLVALIGIGGVVWVQRRASANAKALQAEAERQKELAAARGNAEEGKGWLEIKSAPDGCAVWINGDLREQTTPAKIEKLPFNREIKVKLTKEGLEAYREAVTLTDAAPGKVISATMKAGSVTVVLKIDPPANVTLDGKSWKGDREKLTGVSAGEEHKIALVAAGYQTKTLTFTANQDETKTFTEKLAKADPSATPDKPAEPTAAAGPATVRVNAKGGFCNVSVNGTSYGPTPTQATVTSGVVRVSCKPPSGPAQSQTVTVGAGGTAKVSFRIDG